MSDLKVVELSKIINFKNHPFKVNEDASLDDLVTSIRENGLLTPLTIRLIDNDKYELISGHRRKKAMELLGIKNAKVYIKNLNDDEAIIEMVDSNMYRDKILPSEKAFAYKMKLDAMKHQGKTLFP